MARIVFEVLVLALIVAAVLYSARQWDNHRRVLASGPNELLGAPPDSVWQAVNHGNASDQTEVLVVLRSPGSNKVWDRRTCDLIANQDPDYEKRLYNAMEDARARAALLNSMRDP